MATKKQLSSDPVVRSFQQSQQNIDDVFESFQEVRKAQAKEMEARQKKIDTINLKNLDAINQNKPFLINSQSGQVSRNPLFVSPQQKQADARQRATQQAGQAGLVPSGVATTAAGGVTRSFARPPVPPAAPRGLPSGVPGVLEDLRTIKGRPSARQEGTGLFGSGFFAKKTFSKEQREELKGLSSSLRLAGISPADILSQIRDITLLDDETLILLAQAGNKEALKEANKRQ